MLNIIFGEDGLDYPNKVSDVDSYFDYTYDQDWFQSDYAKQIIKDIDDSQYISGEYIESPVLGGIPPRNLSSGCKALLILLNEPDVIVSGDRMGDNCYPWVMKLAAEKNLTITLAHIVKLEEPFQVRDIMNNKIITTNFELLKALL